MKKTNSASLKHVRTTIQALYQAATANPPDVAAARLWLEYVVGPPGQPLDLSVTEPLRLHANACTVNARKIESS